MMHLEQGYQRLRLIMDGHKVDSLIEGLQAILAKSQERRDSLIDYNYHSGNQSRDEDEK